MWNKSLIAAIEVGKLVESLLPKSISSKKVFSHEHEEFQTEEWYYIEALQNCREQGITIWIPYVEGKEGFTFYITLSRHNGVIGYYLGKHISHGVSEEAFKNGFITCFDNDYCAKSIVRIIEKYLEI